MFSKQSPYEKISANQYHQPSLSKKNVVVLGPIEAGKSNLIRALLKQPTPELYKPTVGMNHLENDKIRYWDIGGKEEYDEHRRIALRKADKVLLVFNKYDGDKRFAQLGRFMQIVKKVNPKATIILVENADHPHPSKALDQASIDRFMKKHAIVELIQASPSKPQEVQQLHERIIEVEKPKVEPELDKKAAENALQVLLQNAKNLEGTEKELLLNIHAILKETLYAKNPEDYFKNNEPRIREILWQLQMQPSSIQNSAYNAFCTVMAVCAVFATGLIAFDYIEKLLLENKRNRGSHLSFDQGIFAKPGSKQQAQEALSHVHQVLDKTKKPQ